MAHLSIPHQTMAADGALLICLNSITKRVNQPNTSNRNFTKKESI